MIKPIRVVCIYVKTYTFELGNETKRRTEYRFQTKMADFNADDIAALNGWLSVWDDTEGLYVEGEEYRLKVEVV